MLLALTNACVRKLVVHVISFFISYVTLEKVNYTYRGYMTTLLEKLEKILVNIDSIYDYMYMTYQAKLPIRYELPSFKNVFSVLVVPGQTLEKVHTLSKLTRDIQRYMNICDVSAKIISEDDSQYYDMCSKVFSRIDKELLELIINMIPKQMRKDALKFICNDDHGLCVEILYPKCNIYGDDFYKTFQKARQKMEYLHM